MKEFWKFLRRVGVGRGGGDFLLGGVLVIGQVYYCWSLEAGLFLIPEEGGEQFGDWNKIRKFRVGGFLVQLSILAKNARLSPRELKQTGPIIRYIIRYIYITGP